MIALMRLVLACAALAVIYLVPAEPDRHVPATYGALTAYALYSAAIYVTALLGVGRWIRPIRDWGHWVDVGWYTTLITLSSGTHSIFFFGYFFPLLVASFRWGYRAGMRVAVASALLFTASSLVVSYSEPIFDGQRFLIRPIFLVVLGYMVASWGGFEIDLRRRLELLKEVGRVSNPRFGIDRIIGLMMHGVMRLHDADDCVLLLTDVASGTHSLRRVRRNQPEGAVPPEPISEGLATLFLAGLGTNPVNYTRRVARNPDDAESASGERGVTATTVDILLAETEAVTAVPFDFRGRLSGALYLSFAERRSLPQADLAFLGQVLDHTLPLVDNVRLVGRLASEAAEEERRRIARGIHDSVIQPYIGLRLGLAALRQKLESKGGDLADLDRMLELTDLGIADLRRQVSSVREGETGGGALLPSLRRFAEKFSDATGIRVHVDTEPSIPVDDFLAGEVFQMVVEGLSNVRRHTQATWARVALGCRDGALELRIENPGDRIEKPFAPYSIVERAAEIGGRAHVVRRDEGGSIVQVEIPL